MAARPPHVIISFDMETDVGNWWTTYEGAIQGTPRILEILSRRANPATFVFTADTAQGHDGAVFWTMRDFAAAWARGEIWALG